MSESSFLYNYWLIFLASIMVITGRSCPRTNLLRDNSEIFEKFCTLAKTRKLWGLKMVSQFFKKSVVSCGLAWIILLQLLYFLSHLLFTRPGSIIARLLGARSCNFSHQWKMSWPCFKDSTSKAYSVCSGLTRISPGL